MFDMSNQKPLNNKTKNNVDISPKEVFNFMAKWEDFTDYDPDQLKIGIEVELEHIDKTQLKTDEDWKRLVK